MSHSTKSAEPAILLIGRILNEDEKDNVNSIQIQVKNNSVIDAPIELADFLNFMRLPRLESEVLAWVSKAGGTPQDLEGMISSGRLLRLSGDTASQRLASFKGLRLMPLCFPVDPANAITTEFSTMIEISKTGIPIPDQRFSIAHIVADAMWDTKEEEDIPSAVHRLTKEAGYLSENADPFTLGAIKSLLASDMAWLAEVESTENSLLKRLFGKRNKK